MRGSLLLGALAAILHNPVLARTLTVGPGQEFDRPSLAFRAAQEGDTVLIEPGEYFDCGSWQVRGLIVAGTGPGVSLTDTTCSGKAILVIQGESATIRDLTLARARVPDGNGAGIRLEAPGLHLERVRFENNQVGLLSGIKGGTISIQDCVFERGGVSGERPTYAVIAGESDLLRIQQSTFRDVRAGQIMSGAQHTELISTIIAAGIAAEPSPVVTLVGVSAALENNTFHLGPYPPLRAAVEGWGRGPITLQGNRVENATGGPVTLLLDWTSENPMLTSNLLQPGDEAVSSRGLVRHRAIRFLRDTRDVAMDSARWAKAHIKALLDR